MSSGRRRRTGSASAAALALALLVGARDAAARPARDEGPLRNQAFVPVDETAAEALRRGDLALATDPAAAADAWFEALAGSTTGAAVPLGAPDAGDPADPADAGEVRAFEGVEEAVLRRLRRPDARRAWVERFGELADERLGGGRGPEPLLRRVERRFPATPAALRAALTLGDGALARGAFDAARVWYGRARVHAELGAGDPGATAPRLALLAELDPPARPAPASGTPRMLAAIELEDPRGPRAALPTDAPGAGLVAGLAPVGDGEVVVQTATRVHRVDLARGQVTALFEPAALLPDGLPRPADPYATREAPAWQLAPSVRGRRLVVVVGRRPALGGGANALLCATLPAPALPELDPEGAAPLGLLGSDGPRPGLGARAAPTLLWALDTERRVAGSGRPTADVGLPADAEFQPGPVQDAERVVVAVRSGDEELATRLVGLDAGDGRPVWELLLAVGGELGGGNLRLGLQSGPAAAATPLLAVSGSVFVGTQTGVGSLVDAVDGRLRWTVKNRRRDDEGRGWSGRRAAAAADRTSLLWAPADGDHLYWLPVGALPEGGDAPFLGPPAPIDADRALAGQYPGPRGPVAVLLADAGVRSALAGREPRTGRRFEGVHLFPGEPLREGLAVAPDRVLACSDRALYAFDPARELLLVDRVPLPSLGAPDSSRWARGGPVHRVGDWALVLESGRLLRAALR